MDIKFLQDQAEAMVHRLETRDALVVALMLSYLRGFESENAELKDKVWASDRAAHAHDEMEPEDG